MRYKNLSYPANLIREIFLEIDNMDLYSPYINPSNDVLLLMDAILDELDEEQRAALKAIYRDGISIKKQSYNAGKNRHYTEHVISKAVRVLRLPKYGFVFRCPEKYIPLIKKGMTISEIWNASIEEGKKKKKLADMKKMKEDVDALDPKDLKTLALYTNGELTPRIQHALNRYNIRTLGEAAEADIDNIRNMGEVSKRILYEVLMKYNVTPQWKAEALDAKTEKKFEEVDVPPEIIEKAKRYIELYPEFKRLENEKKELDKIINKWAKAKGATRTTCSWYAEWLSQRELLEKTI